MAAEHDVVEVYEDDGGEWRWRRIAANGEKVADSGEGYTDSFGGIRAARREADGKAEIRVVKSETPAEDAPAEEESA